MRRVLALILCLLTLRDAVAATITVTHSWDVDTGTATAGVPFFKGRPDPSVAVSPNYIVVLDGQRLTVYDKSGSGTAVQREDMVTFYKHVWENAYNRVQSTSPGGGTPIETHILWYPQLGRFVMALNGTNDIISVSAGDDPRDGLGTGGGGTQNWDSISPSAQVAASSLTSPDSCTGAVGGLCNHGDLFTRIGFNADFLFIAEFSGGASYTCTTQCGFAFPLADLQWTPGVSHISLTHIVANTFRSSLALNAEPVIDNDSASGNPLAIVTRNGSQNGTNLALTPIVYKATISGTTVSIDAGTTITPGTSVLYNLGGGNAYVAQPSLPSPFVGIRAAENFRFYQSFQTGTTVWITAHSGTTASSALIVMKIYWFKLDISGTPAILDQGWIDESSGGISDMHPAVTVDSNGTAVIAHTRASSSISAGVVASYHLSTDSAGVMNGPTTLQAGGTTGGCAADALASGTVTLWGNTNSVALDPDGLTVYAVNQYMNSATDCNWYLRLVGFQVTLPNAGGSAVQGYTKFSGSVIR